MPFPISYNRENTFYIYTDINDLQNKTEKKIIDMLTEGYMKKIERNENKIVFSGSIFRFVWNGFHLCNGITKGKFSFENRDNNKFIIRTKLFFWEALSICVIFSLLSVIMFANQQDLLAYALLAVIWLGLFIGNYLLSFIRINSFIDEFVQKTYDETIKSKGIDESELKRVYNEKQA